MIENQEIRFTKGLKSGMESGKPFIRFQLVYYMLGTTTRLSMLLQVLGLWLHFFIGLGLTVTVSKKVQKQDLKNIKNVKGFRDGIPESMQKGRDDIIVNVNLQSPTPTSFCITVAN